MATVQRRNRYAPRYEPTLAREISATVQESNSDEVTVRMSFELDVRAEG